MKPMILTLLIFLSTSVYSNQESPSSLTAPLEDQKEMISKNILPIGENKENTFTHHHLSNKKGLPFGSFYTIDPTEISTGSPILFNRESAANNLVKLLSDGSIILKEKGDYYVSYGVAAIGPFGVPIRIALALNGITQPGSTISFLPVGALSNCSIIIHVSEAPTTLTIINNGTFDILLNSLTPNDVTAFVNIYKLKK